ncbi:MAG: hypothetical protein J6M27_11780 [Lachnospiraceae bacterium]|nr:hypothetical protein [Lachnospiraceae bacterium]
MRNKQLTERQFSVYITNNLTDKPVKRKKKCLITERDASLHSEPGVV